MAASTGSQCGTSVPKKPKTVSLAAFKNWELELQENFEMEEEDGRVVKLICNVCKDFADTLKLKSRYKGKVIEDVVKYGKHGTTYILKPNLKRHMQSEGHKVCLEMKTGMPRSKKQKTITDAYGGALNLAEESLKPLSMALYVCHHEKPYSEYESLIDMIRADLGLRLNSSYNNPHAAKIFCHLIADEMLKELRCQVESANFFSWLCDGSAAAKK